ncbi:hypothetical protein [Neobacillus thermocopriae]|uniref:Uncharacterized protein n=1 Tax=Neobacillus thermocopriae TaxID=1215031 RepID=A0A6B3TQ70_9BACI|nr:hypothetical protein [Neobacillus thermocopriae]MED3624535.1 hypothetical protein [Neobacillus thermocopriae]MED3712928.1 hypothetical protein [Neobacillus thermocopriae]NEX79145.1 hypothetical protein [Neobacillus thermocopriae]
MVNENFDKFRQVLSKHKTEYLGTDRKQKTGLNDEQFNNQSITDQSPGSTGRKI